MINILVTGDYSPQYRVSELIDGKDYDPIFGEVKTLTQKMDYSIVNFESAVADGTDSPLQKCGPNLHCHANCLEAIKWAGFDMVTLANNHFYDYGDSSLEKSFGAIKANGLDHVGAGHNLQEALQIFYKNIKGKTFAIINCCEHEFTIATESHGGCNPLNPIQQYYQIKEAKEKSDYVIVIVHGGHEYFQLPSPRMQETYQFFIDSGADVVVNHHQHCYSGYEYYKGKPIVYGLGNFCFDYAEQKQIDCWYEGYALQLVLNEDDIKLILHPYIQCKELPSVTFLNDTRLFEQKIAAINGIIADEKLLAQKIEEYYQKSSAHLLEIFEPYLGRYLRAAYSRHLLPSFFKGRRCLMASNYVNCESHLDKLRAAIKGKLLEN